MRFSLRMAVGVLAAASMVAGCTRGEEEAATKVSPAAPAAVTPVAGVQAPAEAEAEAGDEILMVWAEAEPEEGPPPLKVQLKADISGGSGERKIKWDFGDSSPASTEVNPMHVYEKTGTFRASVEVSDGTGDSDSDYVDITVGSE